MKNNLQKDMLKYAEYAKQNAEYTKGIISNRQRRKEATFCAAARSNPRRPPRTLRCRVCPPLPTMIGGFFLTY